MVLQISVKTMAKHVASTVLIKNQKNETSFVFTWAISAT